MYCGAKNESEGRQNTYMNTVVVKLNITSGDCAHDRAHGRREVWGRRGRIRAGVLGTIWRGVMWGNIPGGPLTLPPTQWVKK